MVLISHNKLKFSFFWTWSKSVKKFLIMIQAIDIAYLVYEKVQ